MKPEAPVPAPPTGPSPLPQELRELLAQQPPRRGLLEALSASLRLRPGALRHARTIVGACVLAACAYGVVHDQITARICVEYFTIGHAPIMASESPTLQGLVWGVLGTWWVGLLLGLGLACAAQLGSWPRRSPASLVRPGSILLATMGVGALLSGLVGRELALRGVFRLVDWLAQRVPAERHVAFLSVGWAHGASYALGLAGGLAVLAGVVRSRYRGALEGIPDEAADPTPEVASPAAPLPAWAQRLARGLAHLALLPQFVLTCAGLLLSTASVIGGRHVAIATRLIALLCAGAVLGLARLSWRWQIALARALSTLCCLAAVLAIDFALSALL